MSNQYEYSLDELKLAGIDISAEQAELLHKNRMATIDKNTKEQLEKFEQYCHSTVEERRKFEDFILFDAYIKMGKGKEFLN